VAGANWSPRTSGVTSKNGCGDPGGVPPRSQVCDVMMPGTGLAGSKLRQDFLGNGLATAAGASIAATGVTQQSDAPRPQGMECWLATTRSAAAGQACQGCLTDAVRIP